MLTNAQVFIASIILTVGAISYLNRKKIKETYQKIRLHLSKISKKEEKLIEQQIRAIIQNVESEQTFILDLREANPKVKEKITHFLFGICYSKNAVLELMTKDMYAVDFLKSGHVNVIKYTENQR